MNRKAFLGVVLGILCLDGVGQNVVDTSYYYYYRGEKQYIVWTTIYMIFLITLIFYHTESHKSHKSKFRQKKLKTLTTFLQVSASNKYKKCIFAN